MGAPAPDHNLSGPDGTRLPQAQEKRSAILPYREDPFLERLPSGENNEWQMIFPLIETLGCLFFMDVF